MTNSATMSPFNFNIGQLYRLKKAIPERLRYMDYGIVIYDPKDLKIDHSIFLPAQPQLAHMEFYKTSQYLILSAIR